MTTGWTTCWTGRLAAVLTAGCLLGAALAPSVVHVCDMAGGVGHLGDCPCDMAAHHGTRGTDHSHGESVPALPYVSALKSACCQDVTGGFPSLDFPAKRAELRSSEPHVLIRAFDLKPEADRWAVHLTSEVRLSAAANRLRELCSYRL